MTRVNNDPNPTVKKRRSIRRAHAFFGRLRIGVRGQIIEDIDNYNRVSDLFQTLRTSGSR